MTSEDIYEKQVSQLKEIRLNPRRMHQSYLKKHGLFSLIMDKTSEPGCIKWNIRDRIDFIIGKTKKIECYCGSGIYLDIEYQIVIREELQMSIKRWILDVSLLHDSKDVL